MVKILGLCGSLRKGSFNHFLLLEAQRIAPESGAEIEIADIGNLPLFNQDDEMEMPAAPAELKRKIEAADAILLVSPEYNYSFSGVLKNAIDWGSRPWGKNSFVKKPAAIMGATIGALGTVRMQYHLRQVLLGAGMEAISRPEVFVGHAEDKFGPDGKLTDESTRKLVGELISSLVAKARG